MKGTIKYSLIFIFCFLNNDFVYAQKDSILDYYFTMYKKNQFKNPDLAIGYLSDAEAYVKANNDVDMLLRVYNIRGWFYTNKHVQIDDAICDLDNAVALIPQCKDSASIAVAYTRRGFVASKNHEISEAMYWYDKALRISYLAKSYENVMYVYNQIGNAYLKLDLYDEALSNYFKALQTAKSDKEINPGIALKNLGRTYKRLGEYQKAEAYLVEALAESIRRKKIKMTVLCKTQLAEVYYYLQNYDKALQYVRENEAYMFAVEYKKDLSKIHLLFSKIYFDQQKDSLALHYAKRAYNKGLKINRLVPKRNASEQLMKIYERLKQPEKALHYANIYHRLKDSLPIPKIRYELERKQLLTAIKEKNSTILALNENFKTKTLHFLFTSSIGVLAVLIGFLVYRRKKATLLQKIYKEEKEKNKIAARLNEQKLKTAKLQNELEAYIRILSESNVKNASVADSETINDAVEQLHNFRILTEDDWTVFKLLFLKVHPDFFENFKQNVPQHSLGDIKLASFIRLHLNNNEIARILGISSESVRKGKYRLRKKLVLNSEKKLQTFIYSL